MTVCMAVFNVLFVQYW